MIIAVVLAVLAISGAIIWLALRRSIHNEQKTVRPGPANVVLIDITDGLSDKESAYVRE